MQEFRAAEVISKTFSVWAKNLLPFTILTAVVYLPIILYTVSVAGDFSGLGSTSALETYETVSGLLGFILNLIATAAVI